MNELENIPANRIEYLCQLWNNALDAKMAWLDYKDVDEYSEVLFDSYKRLIGIFCDGVFRIAEAELVDYAELRRYVKFLVAQEEKAAKNYDQCCFKIEELNVTDFSDDSNIFEGELEW